MVERTEAKPKMTKTRDNFSLIGPLVYKVVMKSRNMWKIESNNMRAFFLIKMLGSSSPC